MLVVHWWSEGVEGHAGTAGGQRLIQTAGTAPTADTGALCQRQASTPGVHTAGNRGVSSATVPAGGSLADNFRASKGGSVALGNLLRARLGGLDIPGIFKKAMNPPGPVSSVFNRLLKTVLH